MREEGRILRLSKRYDMISERSFELLLLFGRTSVSERNGNREKRRRYKALS